MLLMRSAPPILGGGKGCVGGCWWFVLTMQEITKLNNGENFTRNPGVQLLERYLASDFVQATAAKIHKMKNLHPSCSCSIFYLPSHMKSTENNNFSILFSHVFLDIVLSHRLLGFGTRN
jgi:hypothetical protein